jgi:hypothetical protein
MIAQFKRAARIVGDPASAQTGSTLKELHFRPRETCPRNNSFEGMKDKSRPAKRRSYLALSIVFSQETRRPPSAESP